MMFGSNFKYEFEMTEAEAKALLDACQPVQAIALQCGIPSNRERIMAAWRALGEKLGFDPDTAEPVRGKSDRFILAVPVPTIGPNLNLVCAFCGTRGCELPAGASHGTCSKCGLIDSSDIEWEFHRPTTVDDANKIEDVDERAQWIIDQGFKQVSRRYRTVTRIPPGMTGLEALRSWSPEQYDQFMTGVQRQAADMYRRMCPTAEKLELGVEEFNAFLLANNTGPLAPDEINPEVFVVEGQKLSKLQVKQLRRLPKRAAVTTRPVEVLLALGLVEADPSATPLPYKRTPKGEALLAGAKQDSAPPQTLRTWAIWSEGFAVTGQASPATHHGNYSGATFLDACKAWAATTEDPKLFKIDNGGFPSYWGCRLYDNETDARKSFG
jgi:hypothetical protein